MSHIWSFRSPPLGRPCPAHSVTRFLCRLAGHSSRTVNAHLPILPLVGSLSTDLSVEGVAAKRIVDVGQRFLLPLSLLVPRTHARTSTSTSTGGHGDVSCRSLDFPPLLLLLHAHTHTIMHAWPARENGTENNIVRARYVLGRAFEEQSQWPQINFVCKADHQERRSMEI